MHCLEKGERMREVSSERKFYKTLICIIYIFRLDQAV